MAEGPGSNWRSLRVRRGASNPPVGFVEDGARRSDLRLPVSMVQVPIGPVGTLPETVDTRMGEHGAGKGPALPGDGHALPLCDDTYSRIRCQTAVVVVRQARRNNSTAGVSMRAGHPGSKRRVRWRLKPGGGPPVPASITTRASARAGPEHRLQRLVFATLPQTLGGPSARPRVRRFRRGGPRPTGVSPSRHLGVLASRCGMTHQAHPRAAPGCPMPAAPSARCCHRPLRR